MPRALRALIVEDSPDDTLLVLRALKAEGYDVAHSRVDSADLLRLALKEGEWDVIFCDYNMPGFTAPDALEIVKESGLDIPFMVISGSVGERQAAEIMRQGAHDFLMKDNLLRLAPIIDREIQESLNRRERRKAEEEVRAKQQELESLNERLRQAMMETHHRVKNSLQIITAMVDLRLLDAGTVVPTEELRRVNSCVMTLAHVHALLTNEAKKDGDASTLSVKEMLERLLPLMQGTSDTCTIDYDLEDVRLPGRLGTSLALITNELVNNAIKHCRGEVRVRLRVQGDTAELTVEDDGPGFPDKFTAEDKTEIGLQLVENLARWDLGADTRYENPPGGGARVCITYPANSLPYATYLPPSPDQ